MRLRAERLPPRPPRPRPLRAGLIPGWCSRASSHTPGHQGRARFQGHLALAFQQQSFAARIHGSMWNGSCLTPWSTECRLLRLLGVSRLARTDQCSFLSPSSSPLLTMVLPPLKLAVRGLRFRLFPSGRESATAAAGCRVHRWFAGHLVPKAIFLLLAGLTPAPRRAGSGSKVGSK